MWYEWRPYVRASEKRRRAAREVAKLQKKGQVLTPISIEGRTIARTFWGKAWCDNLERYSDYENRLPRGRTYVRNGSVLDLKIAPAEVKALVSGSALYRVAVKVRALPRPRWNAISKDCAGGIDSLVELLRGRFSDAVMERLCQEKTGLFPSPAEMQFTCSCPDWAVMCKHVAAVLYGVGARLDREPELLFRMREVDEKDLIARAGSAVPLSRKRPAADKVLAADGLSELFGLEMAGAPAAAEPAGLPAASPGRRRKPASRTEAPARATAKRSRAASRPTSKPKRKRGA